jgi:hypothetical protein
MLIFQTGPGQYFIRNAWHEVVNKLTDHTKNNHYNRLREEDFCQTFQHIRNVARDNDELLNDCINQQPTLGNNLRGLKTHIVTKNDDLGWARNNGSLSSNRKKVFGEYLRSYWLREFIKNGINKYLESITGLSFECLQPFVDVGSDAVRWGSAFTVVGWDAKRATESRELFILQDQREAGALQGNRVGERIDQEYQFHENRNLSAGGCAAKPTQVEVQYAQVNSYRGSARELNCPGVTCGLSQEFIASCESARLSYLENAMKSAKRSPCKDKNMVPTYKLIKDFINVEQILR